MPTTTISIDPEKAFLHGLQFELASVWLWKDQAPYLLVSDSRERVTTAICVNASFAAEIYLKTLQMLDQGGVTTGHKLKVLFEPLSPSVKSKAKSHYLAAASATTTAGDDFDTTLDNASSAFEEWRYKFESSAQLSWSGSVLVKALRCTIAELKPVFHQHVPQGLDL